MMMSNRARKTAQAIFLALFMTCVLSGPFYYYPTITSAQQNTQKEINHILEAEHADDRIARYNGWLAIFTGLLFTVSAVQIYFLTQADKTARTIADAAIQANRAWVHVRSIQFTQPLKVLPQGAVASVEVIIENVGRSPALGVNVWVQFIPMAYGIKIDAIGAKVLKEALKQATLLSPAVFPDQKIPQRYGISITRDEWIPAVYPMGGLDRVSLCLGVCVCYRPSRTGELKYSYRIFPSMSLAVSGGEWAPENLNMGMGSSQWDDAS
jgi:hypothetical protein